MGWEMKGRSNGSVFNSIDTVPLLPGQAEGVWAVQPGEEKAPG